MRANAHRANTPGLSPALHSEVSDPLGDALATTQVLKPPDLLHATADVASGNIAFRIQLAPGSWDPQTTVLIIEIDTDQNPGTGQFGTDYIVSMGSGHSDQALIGKYGGTRASFPTVGNVPVTVTPDGVNVTVPLSLLGNHDGKLDFRVESFTHWPNTPTTAALDFMPNAGLKPARIP